MREYLNNSSVFFKFLFLLQHCSSRRRPSSWTTESIKDDGHHFFHSFKTQVGDQLKIQYPPYNLYSNDGKDGNNVDACERNGDDGDSNYAHNDYSDDQDGDDHGGENDYDDDVDGDPCIDACT